MVIGALDTVASYDSDPRTPAGMEWDPIRAVGDVTVAAGRFVYTRLLDVAGGLVLCVEVDEMDVESAAVYALAGGFGG